MEARQRGTAPTRLASCRPRGGDCRRPYRGGQARGPSAQPRATPGSRVRPGRARLPQPAGPVRLAEPARPGRLAWSARPGQLAWPVRLARPASPARPARPAGTSTVRRAFGAGPGSKPPAGPAPRSPRPG